MEAFWAQSYPECHYEQVHYVRTRQSDMFPTTTDEIRIVAGVAGYVDTGNTIAALVMLWTASVPFLRMQ